MADSDNLHSRRTAAQMHALAAVRREMRYRDSASGGKYLREFTQVFRRYDEVLTPEQLNEKVAAASILLVGDYHALAASQRFTAELLEKVAHRRQVVVGLEAVLSRDQRILDAWWRREITENELRQRLHFDREWGYDWLPFYELLSSARDHAEGVYGLDCMPRNDLRRIGSRDRHAAAKICQMREQHPDAAIVVLFGESHMAPQHLPRFLRKSLPGEEILTILQNVDALYWQALAEKAGAVSVSESTVCVFNSTPLEKVESYRMCFERWNAASDDLPDFAPAVYNLIFSLATCLGFRLDSPRNGTQPKFLADSLPEVVSVNTDPVASLAKEDAQRLEETGCVYVPENNTFLIREFQMAAAAKESARFLHYACRGMVSSCIQAKVIEEALARFGSRLLSPEVGEDGISDETPGDILYRAYLGGRVAKPALRRMFLSKLEDSEQVATTLKNIQEADAR